mgnify:CR=1 FL=1
MSFLIGAHMRVKSSTLELAMEPAGALLEPPIG